MFITLLIKNNTLHSCILKQNSIIAKQKCIKKVFNMEISEIKSLLTLSAVLHHYGLKPDKNARLHCPFHDDRTPSMQVYYKTHTAYCFSGSCPTHGKSMDVIDFIMYKENISKHEALKKCADMLGGTALPPPESLSRETFLNRMFGYFRNAVYNSAPARDYIAGRQLDWKTQDIGYNSGQFHHSSRRDETLIRRCLDYGLLSECGKVGRTGETAYRVFGKNCIVFPLKSVKNQIVSLYFRSTANDGELRHFYLKNRQGLYPGYPPAETKKLILTESIIDAASLSQLTGYSILALYGTNGFTPEHAEAVKNLTQLEEIIFFLNGDDAGNKAANKYAGMLQAEYPLLEITLVNVPEGEDVNSLLQGHNPDIFVHLLNERKPFFLSNEKEKIFSTENTGENKKELHPATAGETDNAKLYDRLNAENPYNLYYSGSAADYYVKGGIRCMSDSLKVSLQIIDRISRMDIRIKADLYEHRQVTNIVKLSCERFGMDGESLYGDLSLLTKELELYRTETIQSQMSKSQKKRVTVPASLMNQCVGFLNSGNLLQRINALLGSCGITGEEVNRLFLFLIAGSYKMPDTLHALIQGSSGSGKTRLLKIICEVMPEEDVIKFTRVTDNSFYNYREDYLVNKLLGFEDIDGLKEEALYAVRELISNEILVSSTTTKTDDGRLVAVERTVRGPVASIGCTTKGEIYEDNMSRLFLIAVDESTEQTKRIIHYQQQTASGMIERSKEKETRLFLQNCVRLLKPYEVVNPYAGQIHLPEQAHKIRRLNDLYLSFVKQITLVHQYQRKKDSQGRLISQKEDLRLANEIMFESIILKVDELDGSLRQFFERLKKHVENAAGRDRWFILRDIRQSLHVGKTRLHRYINELLELEYLQQDGHANRGYRYKISYWDNIEALRNNIKMQLEKQIEAIECD